MIKRLLLLYCSFSVLVFGALSVNTVFELRTTGSDTNGGGYVLGSSGIDMSVFDNKNAAGCTSCQSAVANLSTTNAVANGTSTITSATAAFTPSIQGNIVYFSGGSGTITGQWRQATYINATSITVDTIIAASTGMTMNIGGALATFGQLCATATSASTSYIKSGTYSITNASTNIPFGACTTTGISVTFIGYGTNRLFGNTDTKPVIQTNANSVTQLVNCPLSVFYNLTFDGNGTAATGNFTGSKLTSGASIIGSTIQNFNTITTGNVVFRGDYVTLNTATTVINFASYIEAYNNTATPISGVGPFYRILTYGNTGATTDGIAVGQAGVAALGSSITSVGNGRYGISTLGSGPKYIDNSYAQDNVNFGFICSGSPCATSAVGFFNNNSAGVQTGVSGGGQIFATGTPTVTGDVFTNKAGNVYTLNSLAVRGAALRAAGLPTVLPGGLTANSLDIGAAQIVPSTGSGSYAIVQ